MTFLLDLPRDLFEVKVVAFVQAMTNAYVGYDNDSCEKGPFVPLLPVLL